jgi:hypothetical protein
MACGWHGVKILSKSKYGFSCWGMSWGFVPPRFVVLRVSPSTFSGTTMDVGSLLTVNLFTTAVSTQVNTNIFVGHTLFVTLPPIACPHRSSSLQLLAARCASACLFHLTNDASGSPCVMVQCGAFPMSARWSRQCPARRHSCCPVGTTA